MDEFSDDEKGEFALLPGTRAFSARLRKNRFIGCLKFPSFEWAVVKENKYKIIHIDTDTAWKALLFAAPAKWCGAKVVVHSHSTGIDGDHKILKRIAHILSRQLLPYFVDKQIACAEEAGKWMFPRKTQNKTTVLYCGTDLERFRYDEQIRCQWRERLGVKDELLIGNIGLISERKNQAFLVSILGNMKKKGIAAKAVLVGGCSSEWEKRLQDLAAENGVSDDLILYGFSNDTPELLNAMDVYVCPSFVEGAPLTLYEAQATGLPCVMASTITKTSMATEWITREDLEAGTDKWCDAILEMNKKYAGDRGTETLGDEYSLAWTTRELSKIYDQLLFT